MPPNKKPETGEIYSATYSNVPVYEFNCNGNHVMRRRSDNWINATHILKVAAYDKPARTRILEREVQKGVHEKVQGGYGKYQGTWIPLNEGRDLAERNNILTPLLPIFDFVPGDKSPPQAPKHTTAASSKPRQPKASTAKKNAKALGPSFISENQYPHVAGQFNGDETPDNLTIASGEFEDEDMLPYSQGSAVSRKRKRNLNDVGTKFTAIEAQYQMYGDSLLDYFLVSDEKQFHDLAPPMPPPGFNVNQTIDNQGHAALHWAASMGDIDVCKDLINRGANIEQRNQYGETPLIRGVLFTNNFEKFTMPKLVNLLQSTVQMTDQYGSTVFHYIGTTAVKHKSSCTRYYQESILNKLTETMSNDDIRKILDTQNAAGDTALHVAARNGSRKLCRSLTGYGASSDIPNKNGEMADHMIATLQAKVAKERKDPQMPFSSSPVQPSASNLFVNSHNSNSPQPTIAQTMISTIVPLIQDKTTTLFEAIASEAHEKDEQHNEALRLLKNVQKQASDTRRAIYTHPIEKDDSNAKQQREDIARLEAEAEILIEKSQWAAVRDAFLESSVDSTSIHSPDDLYTPLQAHEKTTAALDLLAAQEERIQLVKEIVKAAAVTGTNEKTGEYRKLIAMALAQPEDQVMDELPSILKSMEDMLDPSGKLPTAQVF